MEKLTMFIYLFSTHQNGLSLKVKQYIEQQRTPD